MPDFRQNHTILNSLLHIRHRDIIKKKKQNKHNNPLKSSSGGKSTTKATCKKLSTPSTLAKFWRHDNLWAKVSYSSTVYPVSSLI